MDRISVPEGQDEALYKSQNIPKSDWDEFKRLLVAALILYLLKVAKDFGDVENQIWTSRGLPPIPYDGQDILAAYMTRTGRHYGDIAVKTEQDIEQIIAEWYRNDEPFGQLVKKAERYFKDYRIKNIADTEVGYILSQVTLTAMKEYKVDEWYWEHFGEDTPCDRPIIVEGMEYNGCKDLNGRTFKIGTLMPPEASHPSCHCLGTPKGI